MIRQDYLLRIIQEIISFIFNALLKKKRIHQQEWIKYDTLTKEILGFSTEHLMNMTKQEVIDQYEGESNHMEKVELAAMTMLKIADEMGEENLLYKSKLQQEGVSLLKYVQEQGASFSLQRLQLIQMLEKR